MSISSGLLVRQASVLVWSNWTIGVARNIVVTGMVRGMIMGIMIGISVSDCPKKTADVLCQASGNMLFATNFAIVKVAVIVFISTDGGI